MEKSSIPHIVKGWHYPMREYIDAHRQGILLKLVTHLSNVCNLSCPGCFVNRPGDDVTEKCKGRGRNEMSFEDQVKLLKEAKKMGIKTVDIVGAGEPTLDLHFDQFVDEVERLEMNLVVFTHGATKTFQKENLSKYINKPISFFIKLWSLNQDKMNGYVRGALRNYAQMRDEAIQNLENLGFMQGDTINLDDRERQITRVGADILVMKSNIIEIPDIFRFCRRKGIMPIIKTYIPQGPTKLDQKGKFFAGLSTEEQERLKANAVTPIEFAQLRQQLEVIDKEEFKNEKLGVFYPQGVICTQSAGSLYITINGDILSCVGTDHIYGKYKPGTDALFKTIRDRIEKVGVGCIPRIEEAQRLGNRIPIDERKILELGSQKCEKQK